MKFDADFVKRQLLDIAKRNSNCFEEYTTIIKSCCTKLMSTGMDLYGMFWPEPILAKYFEYKGKLTSNNDKKNFIYYFDTENKLRITERYDSNGELLNYIFYYYYDNLIEIIWYNVKRKVITTTGFINYECGILSSYVESYDLEITLKNNLSIKSYHGYLYNVDKEYIIHKIYSEEIYNDGRIFEKITKIKK